jgi:hypothetical protein
VDASPEHRYDVIVVDVFEGAAMPMSVAGVGFATAAARLLRPDGVLAMNLTDVPPLSSARIQTATLRAAFADVALIAPPGAAARPQARQRGARRDARAGRPGRRAPGPFGGRRSRAGPRPARRGPVRFPGRCDGAPGRAGLNALR